MRTAPLLALFVIACSPSSFDAETFCSKGQTVLRADKVQFSAAQIVFIMGNIYVSNQAGNDFYRVAKLSRQADRIVEEVDARAQRRHFNAFQSRGSVSGSLVTCGPRGQVGLAVDAMALSDPTPFSQADFDQILRTVRGKAG